jgi:hypothetical protein
MLRLASIGFALATAYARVSRPPTERDDYGEPDDCPDVRPLPPWAEWVGEVMVGVAVFAPFVAVGVLRGTGRLH